MVGVAVNKVVSGDSGNDIFVFRQGFGQGTIANFDDAAGRVDKIVFESWIAPADMLVRRQGNDLLLSSADGDSVRVVGHFNDDGVGRFSITEVHFADGTVWTDVTLKSLALGGTVDSDVLKGYTSDDLVHGNR